MRQQLATLLRTFAILALTIGGSSGSASASIGVLFEASHHAIFGSGFPLPATGGVVTGMGVAIVDDMVGAPRPFVLPAHAIAGITMTQFIFPQPTSFPFYTDSITASFDIPSGMFGLGLGPGAGKVWCPGHFGAGMGGNCPAATPSAGTKPGLIRYTGGAGFGGTAGILGVYSQHVVIRSGAGFITGDIVQNHGGVPGGPPGGTATGMGLLQHTTQGFTSPQTVGRTGAPWTTGTVIASDIAGNLSSLQTASGYDNRNAAGTMGAVRLVTPTLSQYFSPSAADFVTAVWFLDVQFIPEAGATLMLATGLLGLAALHRLRLRRA